MKIEIKREKFRCLSLPFLFLITAFSGFLIQSKVETDSTVKFLCLVGCLSLFALCVYWTQRGKMTAEKWLTVIFLVALIARLCYVSTIPITKNQHDTSWFGKEKNYGHTGYIQYLLDNHHLPDFDVRGKSQFYHPPLHHILAALWIELQQFLGVTFEAAIENIQLLTVFYSMTALYASGRIFKLLGLKGKGLIAAFSVVAFHPTFFLLSGSINNDCLSVCLTFCAVWATLEWHKSKKLSHIIAIALCLGGAMAAKLTAGLLAPAIALLFLYDFISAKGKKAKWELFFQFAIFGVICIPLGIGWEVRNFVKFGVPLTYVPRLSDTASQYLGDYTVAERLFDFRSLKDFGVFPSRTGTQEALYFDHCIPLTALKSALFGEYSVWRDNDFYNALGNLLFVLNGVLVLGSIVPLIASAVAFLRSLPKKAQNRLASVWHMGLTQSAFLYIYLGTILMSYVLFCFQYPHFCSMDFRYIVPTLLVGSVFLGKAISALGARRTRLSSACASLLIASVPAFALCSALMYPLYF